MECMLRKTGLPVSIQRVPSDLPGGLRMVRAKRATELYYLVSTEFLTVCCYHKEIHLVAHRLVRHTEPAKIIRHALA